MKNLNCINIISLCFVTLNTTEANFSRAELLPGNVGSSDSNILKLIVMTQSVKHSVRLSMRAIYLVQFLIVIILLTSSLQTNAQSKQEQKLKKYYEKENYEKCLHLADRNIKKSKDKSSAYYYKSLVYYTEFKNDSRQADSIQSLKKALVNFENVKKYTKPENYTADFESLGDSLHIACSQMAEMLYYSKSKQKSKHFYDWLATSFSDTTEQYAEFHKTTPGKTHEITEPIFSVNDSLTRLRKTLTVEASKLVGTPYKYGGDTDKGLDCSGFTQYVYKKAGIELPHNANMQSQLGVTIPLEKAQAGDLIFFGTTHAYHAGMIYDNKDGKITLAHCVSGGVDIQAANDSNVEYWLGRVLVVKRIVGENIEGQLQAQLQAQK